MSNFTMQWNERDLQEMQELSINQQRTVLYLAANKFAQIASDIVSREATDTGNLSQGIATGMEPKVFGYDEYIITDQTRYGIYVNDGTQPHMPPIDALKDWARRTLGDESAAWPVAMKIKERGTKPIKFWERAYVTVRDIHVPAYIQQLQQGQIRELQVA